MLALLGFLTVFDAAAENRLSIESGPGRAGPLTWEAVDVEFTPAKSGEGAWRIGLSGASLPGLRGDLVLDCLSGDLEQGRPVCREGQFEWRPDGADQSLVGRLFEPDGTRGLGIDLIDGRARVLLAWPGPGSAASARLILDQLDVASLPRGLLANLPASAVEGRIDGQLDWDGRALAVELALADGAFDSADGRHAGAGLALALEGSIEPQPDSPAAFELRLRQDAGELLMGPVYLPPPQQAAELSLAGRLKDDGALEVARFAIDDGSALSAAGQLALASAARGRSLERLQIEAFDLSLPAAWDRWLEGPAATRGFGGMTTQGRLRGAIDWAAGRPPSYRLDVQSLEIEDEIGRFSIAGLSGQLESGPQRQEASLDWQALGLFRLEFGPSRLRASGEPGRWRLDEALTFPLLDGAVVIETMALEANDEARPAVALDARIEPLALSELTRMLGWPEFGGSLSGAFPGVEVDAGRIAFTGGIDVQAFSGAIRLRDLVIERPFGSLPALAAQVAFERLDLASLTGAFNFGHMEGQVSGWMNDLRLLDWQPAAMDARVFTHEDVPERRISQRAVENLSRLGGGASALGATFLQMFQEFPYRRAGLACRLDRNICHMDGVAEHSSGGFYIVEGRSLPRLDVIGHRRLVDWPRLVAQMVAITRD